MQTSSPSQLYFFIGFFIVFFNYYLLYSFFITIQQCRHPLPSKFLSLRSLFALKKPKVLCHALSQCVLRGSFTMCFKGLALSQCVIRGSYNMFCFFIIKNGPHMVEISQDGYFLQKLSLFFQLQRLIMSTFCIESTVSIDSPGQSCLPELGKSSFWPATSGKVPKNYL